MPGNNAVISSDRFDQTWSDNPDADPPPGRDLADALLKAYSTEPGCSTTRQAVGDDDWEHTYWFIWVKHVEVEYRIDVECTLVPEEKPGKWRLIFSRQRGLLRSLFCKPSDDELPLEFRELTERLLKKITGTPAVEWLPHNEGQEAVY